MSTTESESTTPPVPGGPPPAPAAPAPRPAPVSTPAGEFLSASDQVKRRALRKMKAIATGALGLMAVIFVIAFLLEDRYPWLGYVRAMAEAGMVGALADWFAVTALFRRPLGLPIPHTAIIPTRKDAIGSSLSEFVATNFLSETVVREKLAGFSVAKRIGEYLARPESAERVTAELASAVRGISTVLSDDQVADLLESMARRKIAETKIGPPLGRISAEVFARGDHHPFVDMVAERCYEWIRDNYTAVSRVVSQRAPSWSPRFLDDMVADRIYNEVLTFARAVKDDPQHQLRQSLDTFLSEFAQDLQHDEATIERAESIKDQVVGNTEVRSLAASAWQSVKESLLRAAEDPDSPLRRSVVQGLLGFGRRLQEDPDLTAKVDGWVADVAGYVARNHARNITGIIDDTVARWDGEATSRKIELQVGRDLQFIRINGTVVGALAGLVIYTFAQLVLT
ncbi:DUF445 domain-containing protein [Nakamurella multipartita]|jgi:uncharacterized membrane-anchored protein YjiN (DUF445 family)|uniref:DUF445 domain-containing protein n=1 Tax=Nakamurella multipartita (strain ATCC 700099 / DSM 44233 / CIP 104796 / JCM 9543 / NBRC 105858 / Y-104) TaxID=479431 RepID=C8XA82_NAKMY|nr:DUF445 domain-containing protein [Nakamurella multipartita]ACV77247.1 protein of unknown function DUF445 [Nakamurella multipartita DSM 44233]